MHVELIEGFRVLHEPHKTKRSMFQYQYPDSKFQNLKPHKFYNFSRIMYQNLKSHINVSTVVYQNLELQINVSMKLPFGGGRCWY